MGGFRLNIFPGWGGVGQKSVTCALFIGIYFIYFI